MNIAEILKECPKGTKLYSPIYGEVKFSEIYPDGMIEIIIKDNSKRVFLKDGSYSKYGECVLFPSKEQRDWKKFRLPIKDGDIMMTIDKRAFITNGKINEDGYPCAYCGINSCHDFIIGTTISGWTSSFYIPVSEEAKKELFHKMAEAGYKWNADTLELEKIEPKFKPFDRVLVKNEANEKWSVNMFSHYYEEDDEYPYVCLSGRYSYCIPYEGNEYLLVLENKQYTI